MAMDRNDHPVIISPSSASIALLRQRFKDMQRQKEMRQERETSPRFVNKLPNKVSGHRPRSVSNSISTTSRRLPLSPGRNKAGDDLHRRMLVVARPDSPASRNEAVDVGNDANEDELDTSLHL
ncbi:hypothetical protein MLD38_012028 [Melastoma candidum]|uniref:Uncharacterized protein n=1 Tax=Melastoma candidum TaxID=119954 RepID=A0ACB9R510_9MYRT|nr:hypothetical protein MLD38_012028 [Melastoma candidum]